MKKLVFILISCSFFGARSEDLKTLSTVSKKIDSPIVDSCPSSQDPCRPHKATTGTIWKTKNEQYELSADNKNRDITKESNKKILNQMQKSK